jgi:hypothetical protein
VTQPCGNTVCGYPDTPGCLWEIINEGAYDALDFAANGLLDRCTKEDDQ